VVVDFAKANGFTVTNTPPNRLLVDINGTVAQIQSAFHVVMTVYKHPTENRTFYSPDREPSLDLSVPVAHIAGLNDYSIPRPMIKKAPVSAALKSNAAGSGPQGATGPLTCARPITVHGSNRHRPVCWPARVRRLRNRRRQLGHGRRVLHGDYH